MIVRNTARPGSTPLSSTAMPSPIAMPTGTVKSVKTPVFHTDCQNTGSVMSLA